jgi:hypothetical protein
MPRALVLLLALSIAAPAAAEPDFDRQELLKNLSERVDKWKLGREDGYIYVWEIGSAMTELAWGDQKVWYEKLRNYAVKDLIMKDPWADGFVGWRYKSGTPLDASGTAEALRLSEGLLAGYKKYGNPDDLKNSDRVLGGYLRHQYVDKGVWMIRNYFNFDTKSFALNSYISGYDADFMSSAGEHNGEAKKAAEETVKLLKKVSADNGFLEEILQPEVLTALPGLSPAFSPNGVRSIFNSCSVLDRATGVVPEQGKKLLEFAIKSVKMDHGRGIREPGLALYWHDDKPMNNGPQAGAATYACLTRLAVRLKNSDAEKMFQPLMERELKRVGKTMQMFDLVESLITARVIADRNSGKK